MGPVFFQAVVSAVIPFEVAFFTFVYLAARKKKQRQPVLENSDPKSPTLGIEAVPSGTQRLKRLPKAPALVILVLTVLVGILAILALMSFSISKGQSGDGPFSTINSLRGPDFGDISKFRDEDLNRIDRWLLEKPVLTHNG
jgi:hypothetical protein